jgi:hypothetical protein
MSKASISRVARRTDAKAAQLQAKRLRAENKHADAIAHCEANKIRGAERLGYIAFESTGMQLGSARGAIAQFVLKAGKSATYTFAEIVKGAKVSTSDVTRANLAYIEHNISALRQDLVGFTVDFDMSAETVSVRPYKAAQKAAPARKARKAAPVTPPASGASIEAESAMLSR